MSSSRRLCSILPVCRLPLLSVGEDNQDLPFLPGHAQEKPSGYNNVLDSRTNLTSKEAGTHWQCCAGTKGIALLCGSGFYKQKVPSIHETCACKSNVRVGTYHQGHILGKLLVSLYEDSTTLLHDTPLNERIFIFNWGRCA